MAIHANSTTVPGARPGLLSFDPSTATLLSTAQLLDLLGGRTKVEATIEGLIGLLDNTDAPGEDREPWLAGLSGRSDDLEEENEHGTDLDHGEKDDSDPEPNLGAVEWDGRQDNWRRSGRPTGIEYVNCEDDLVRAGGAHV